MKQKNRQNSTQAGFTLIELIVAIGIFGLVLGMISGIFILALTSQRRIIALRNVEDNTRFAIESMAREIRTGQNFISSVNSLSFTNAKGEPITYRLNNKTVEKSSDGVNYSVITGPEVTVDYLNFNLSGEVPPPDKLQPKITVAIGITSKVGNQTGNLKIQTTVSARLLQL